MVIYEKAPAKINLTLDVLYKREDGYHEVEMVMTMIDLADRLTLKPIDENRIVIESQAGYIPLDEKNLAYQAAQLLKQRFGIKQGIKIYIEKNIPVAAGLAGGSSDAAATLRGLNRLWGLNLPVDELMELGGELGSDVPFCVKQGTALASGRGEIITPLPSPPSCWVIIAKPPISVSTADVYGRLRADQILHHPSSRQMIEGIRKKDLNQIIRSMGNVLEEVTIQHYPHVRQLKECMRHLGAEGAMMSGSGPTVFALVEKESKVAAIYNGLRGFCKEVYAVRLLTTAEGLPISAQK